MIAGCHGPGEPVRASTITAMSPHGFPGLRVLEVLFAPLHHAAAGHPPRRSRLARRPQAPDLRRPRPARPVRRSHSPTFFACPGTGSYVSQAQGSSSLLFFRLLTTMVAKLTCER
jgi:hypothetical protein